MISNKIIRYENGSKIKQLTEGKKTVLVGGCFDILHYGHVRFLSQAKAKGEVLMVALESDEFIRRIKKKKPIHTQEQRAEILAHLDLVDMIIFIALIWRKGLF